MATAKQIAARKLFAARARAGTLRKAGRTKKVAADSSKYTASYSEVERAEAALRLAQKHAARKKAALKSNPTKKRAISRPSQATGKPPTKRLKARRKANVVPGAFPNPSFRKQTGKRDGMKTVTAYAVGTVENLGNGIKSMREIIAHFPIKSDAVEYARAYASQKGVQLGIVKRQILLK